MTNPAKPAAKPSRPNFSSGPCAKRPGWSPDNLKLDSLGRSHRSKLGKARLKLAIDKTRELLKIPADYRIGIMPGSDTGAIEAAFWSMLGARPVDVFAFESFGEDWVTDVTKQLKVDATVHKAGYGQLPDMSKARKDADVIFTWNGTTSGVKVPNADWIAANREGLVFCDATSAVFAMPIDWSKVDVLTYSWQKVLGGEGAHGMLILSPRAIQRLETYTPAWPMPKLFRMAKGGKVTEGIFAGETINTPSMLAVEDYLDALGWVESLGGVEAMYKRSDANLAVMEKWVAKTPWVEFLAADPKVRSNTSVTFSIVDPRVTKLDEAGQQAFVKSFTGLLEKEGAAFDIGGYKAAPPGLRIWCGATVDASDLEAVTPWLDWAFATAAAELS
ncbi:MAG: phosphoserine transaminase [Alphaproteobacteria bacterium]|nr:phosphoserine transaminase [Alphaproteobacteria bacterium]